MVTLLDGGVEGVEVDVHDETGHGAEGGFADPCEGAGFGRRL
jgi:hypothetical protein